MSGEQAAVAEACPCGHDAGDHGPSGSCRMCWWDHATALAPTAADQVAAMREDTE